MVKDPSELIRENIVNLEKSLPDIKNKIEVIEKKLFLSILDNALEDSQHRPIPFVPVQYDDDLGRELEALIERKKKTEEKIAAYGLILEGSPKSIGGIAAFINSEIVKIETQ